MKEKVKLTIVDKNGKEREATILLYFKLTEFDKEYVVYTYGEVDANDLETIYTSTVIKGGINGTEFGEVETEEEWTKIKEVMKAVIRSNKE